MRPDVFTPLKFKLLVMQRVLLFAFLSLNTLIGAQENFSTLTQYSNIGNIGNTACASSYRICGNVQQQFHFDPILTPAVSHDLYYYFQAMGPATPGFQLLLTGGNGTWSFYGPFTSFSTEVCDQLQAYNGGSSQGNVNAAGVSIPISSAGYYVLKVTPSSLTGTVQIVSSANVRFDCSSELSCTSCVTSFSPTAGSYIVSAWVKELDADPSLTSYTKGALEVSFEGSSQVVQPMLPSGAIIDGWQRIESELQIPSDATGLSIQLQANGADVLFDDIRFFPVDGSMMSYVYDPVSLRLMAELDERNYATLYEYDEEGKLIRVKKETERGIMTIQENRDNVRKQ